jgi:hypothetical protein
METPSIQVTVPATSNSSCHGTEQDTRSWLGGGRGLIIAGVVAAAAAALATRPADKRPASFHAGRNAERHRNPELNPIERAMLVEDQRHL